MDEHPVIIGFDGTELAERAISEAASVLAVRHALVVFVWEAGRAFDFADVPSLSLGLPPAGIDIRTAVALEHEMADSARKVADRGAELATQAGFKAEGLAVADDTTVAETLARLAGEHKASVLVVGSHGHHGLTGLLLGSTAQGVLKHAQCPVLIAHN